jgi:hypothetical protein
MNRLIPLVLVAAIAAWLLFLVLRNWWARRQIIGKASRGRRIEDKAGDVLAGLGYAVITQHPSVPYTWTLDGEPMVVKATPDWLVKKDGKTYLVEVKTGAQANPKSAKTRRQMLEYYLYGNVDGVLYFDGDTGVLQSVSFPTPVRLQTPSWVWPTILSTSGLAIIALWQWSLG